MHCCSIYITYCVEVQAAGQWSPRVALTGAPPLLPAGGAQLPLGQVHAQGPELEQLIQDAE